MEDPDGAQIKRSERRTKTMPAASVSPVRVGEDPENEPENEAYGGAVSMPMGEMARYRMGPATVGQPSIAPSTSIGSSFQKLEPAIIQSSLSRAYPTMSIGPQQMTQVFQPLMMQSMPLPKPIQPAAPPGIFLPKANTQSLDISSVDGRSLLGKVWTLSQDPQGCRQVQAAFDNGSDDVCLALAHELRGHVNEALHSPHANFVVRKCVERTSPLHLQFVIDELLMVGSAGIHEAARHRYGCRIIEALLITCPSVQLQPIASLLLEDISGLCGHMYGNFVMQKLLEHGTDDQIKCILEVLHIELGTLGASFYGSAVYGTALKTVPIEDRCLLASSLASNPNILVALSRFKHGPEIVDLCLGFVDDATSQAIRAQLATAAAHRQQAAATAVPAQPKMAKVIGEKKQRRSSTNSNVPILTRGKYF